MKQLYETSYLTPLSEKLILEHGQSAKQDQEKELSNLVCTKLDGLLLKNVTYLSYCRSLKICSLSNNFLTTIDALAYCPHLVKLDLHSNQIVQLPGEYFWAGLKNLHLLYLHDNSITDLENVHSLSTCTNLLGLTMYDTPVSLQKIYRHCTVNSIWSLKALDKYIISDEEIIEDWHLPGIFKAFNHRLRVNILPAKNTVTSLQDEIKSMNHIISKINQILAHTSPVLIIQRWIRGHMTRKRLGMIPFMTKVHHRDWLPNKKKYSYGRSTPSLKDYWSSVLTAKQELTMHDKKHKTAVQDVQDTRYFLDESVRSKRENKHEQMQQKKHEETRKQIILADKQTDYSGPTEEEEKIQFRLSGYRICICESSPVRNMLLHRKESGNDIRFAIQHFHSMNLEFSKPCKPYLPPMTLEKRLFTKLYGSLSLTPFETVEKAYKERQRSETMARKKDWVKQIHSAKEEAKNHILGFLEEKKNISLRKKEDDSRMILGNIEQCKSSRSQFIKESKEKNAKFLQWKRKKTAEHLLAQNFNCHNSSVGKALLKHHLLVKRGDARQGAIQLVKACRELQEENKDQVKECLEKRKLMLQAENSAEKDELHSYIWEETNQRLLLARKRVAMLKTLRTTKEPMLPVPVDQRSNEGAYLMQSCEANDL